MSHVFSLKNDALDGIVLVEAANRARAVRYLASHTTADLIEGGDLAKAMQSGAKFFDATQEADAESPADPASEHGALPANGALPREPGGFTLGAPSERVAFGA